MLALFMKDKKSFIFDLKFNIKDIIAGVIAIILIVASLIFTNIYTSSDLENATVKIYYKNENLPEYSVHFSDIENEKTIVLTKEDCPDMLGETFTIVINKDKGICVQDIECPNHYCEATGWVKKINIPVTCLPNQIYVVLENASADTEFVIG